ncbi:hypothetical protein [Bacillus badius]|uniref:Uncharacterized protein n=1 Tax=Bacillus badius TaxID=1455 RepID=A0ABR5ANP4_BACBA|nr:hypothetical protein [Bacillus badius]KIL72503.1 hypothetical protein SD77_3476 [Bacillus badius]MED4718282.1 hypothetical protein [Bacillus badius]UAT31988.1 hypothetical protein K7T73_07145 [Bacillus badius]
MNGLLLTSKEEKLPIELMYLSDQGEISHRLVIITQIQKDYIKAYCFYKKQPRTFKRANILAASKPRKGVEGKYA